MAGNTDPARLSLFDSSTELAKLYRSMSVVRRDKAQIIIYEGDEVNQFYYLKSGYVKMYNINDDGEERTLLLLKPGDIFPLLKDPAVPKYISPYFYDTMSEAQVGVIKQEVFLKEVAVSRDTAWALLRYVSEFSDTLTKRLEQIENKTAEGKLETLLPYLVQICGKRKGDAFRLELKLTHQDLANLLGIARETVSREIQTLVKRGLLTSQGGYFVIPMQKQST